MYLAGTRRSSSVFAQPPARSSRGPSASLRRSRIPRCARRSWIRPGKGLPKNRFPSSSGPRRPGHHRSVHRSGGEVAEAGGTGESRGAARTLGLGDSRARSSPGRPGHQGRGPRCPGYGVAGPWADTRSPRASGAHRGHGIPRSLPSAENRRDHCYVRGGLGPSLGCGTAKPRQAAMSARCGRRRSWAGSGTRGRQFR